MVQDPHASRFIRFGLFEADLLNGDLRKSGLKIRLQGRPFEILQILLESPGDLVTRETFRQRLWPADTFVDFDHSLNASISKLRQALGDEAENPRFIATEGRRGYRFIAPVQRVSSLESAAIVPPESSAPGNGTTTENPLEVPPSQPARAASGKRLSVLFTIVVVLPTALFAYRWLSPLPSPRIVRTRQLTNSGRADDWGSVSTDDVKVYYVERDGDHWNAMQTSINGGEVLPIGPTFRNVKILDYSPRRSEFLAGTYSMRWDNQMALWALPVQGGALRRIADLHVIDAAFTPDGERIAYGTSDAIYLATPDGEGARKLVSVEVGPVALRWSADGKLLRFGLFEEKSSRILLWEIAADGSNLHRVTLDMAGDDYAGTGTWSPDGKYFFFTGVHDGVAGLWSVNQAGTIFHRARNEPIALTSGPVEFFDPVISKDSKRLFALGGNITDVVMRYDTGSKQLEVPIAWSQPAGILSYAKDGRIAYVTGPHWELWRSAGDGSERMQLTPKGLATGRPAWSPDGTQIVFQGGLAGEPKHIYLVSASGGSPKQIPPGAGSQWDPDWFPDGKSLVFSVPDEKGLATTEQTGIFQLNLETWKVAKLPNSEGFLAPRWSSDGKYLAAVTGDQKRLMVYDRASGQWSEWASGKLLGYLAWSSDSRSIYFQDSLGEQQSILRVQIPEHKITHVSGCDVALRQGFQRCVFLGLTPDGSPLLSIRQNQFNVYAFDLEYQ